MVKKICSYLFTIILSLIAIMLTLSFLLKWNLKEENIKKFIKENDFTFILKTRDGEESDLLNDIKVLFKTFGIPESAIHEIVNSEATKEFLGTYTYHVLNYMIYKKGNIYISQEDLVKLAYNNFPIIEEILKKQHIVFKEEQKEKILKIIEEEKDEILDFFPTVKILEDRIQNQTITIYKNITLDDLNVFLEIFSNKTYIVVMFIFFFGCVGILFIIHYKSILFLKYIKSSLFIYTFFFITVEIFLGTVFKEFLMLEWKSANSFFNFTVNKISKNLWVFLLISIILIILINIIIKKSKVKCEISSEKKKTCLK